MALEITSKTDLDLKAQDEAIQKWASMVQRFMRGAATVLQHGKESTVQRPGHTEQRLENSIKASTRRQYGVVNSVSIKFERHGVFVHKGVGRGYQMQGGVIMRTAKIEDPLTRQVSPFGKTPRPRIAYPWFNPIVEQTLPELADKLAEINADAVVNATRMMIQ